METNNRTISTMWKEDEGNQVREVKSLINHDWENSLDKKW